MEEKEYNLLEEPWIKVLTNDIEHKEVSLTDVLVNAHKYRQLAGETATQDAAILRLLLAIATTIFYRYEPDGTDSLLCEESDFEPYDVLERWQVYRDLGRFPEEVIKSYLWEYHERFWLFHPETPFYQVAGLAFGSDYGTACLLGNIKESNNKATKHHFSLLEGEEIQELGYPEAARWLLHFNAYAVNVKSDKKAPGTNNPVGTGRMGRLGFIFVNGSNLFETILLNLCALKDGVDLWNPPKPIWEEPVCRLQAREIPIPDNIPEAYTLQSRRICLKKSASNKVCGFKVMGGDYYTTENEISEQMTVWRSRVDKKTKVKTEFPKIHDPDVQVWREFSTILCEDSSSPEKARLPGVVKWVERLLTESLVDPSAYITLQTVGIVYGDGMSYTLGNLVNDSMTFSTSLMLEMGRVWNSLITDEIEKCKQVSDLLRIFSDDICTLLYGKNPGKKDSNRRQLIQDFYFRIDKSFRQWLLSIVPGISDRDQKIVEWERIAYFAGRETANSFIISIGNAMYRTSHEEGKKANYVPRILNQYLMGLSRIYNKYI